MDKIWILASARGSAVNGPSLISRIKHKSCSSKLLQRHSHRQPASQPAAQPESAGTRLKGIKVDPLFPPPPLSSQWPSSASKTRFSCLWGRVFFGALSNFNAQGLAAKTSQSTSGQVSSPFTLGESVTVACHWLYTALFVSSSPPNVAIWAFYASLLASGPYFKPDALICVGRLSLLLPTGLGS